MEPHHGAAAALDNLEELFQMSRMLGLPTCPGFFDIDVDPETDRVVGLM